ncbi:MAG: septal ring lytic transglycosylase RlpA family protein [Hyphomicrobiales bacterium]|nr:septal ring lytic transglycosylase RlpA family protein [Hyphomicrobiales bacterium]MCP4997986.1 septal ring lytic transglycosylase RlpA family protein [Hyphomicrobiales bacterium]
MQNGFANTRSEAWRNCVSGDFARNVFCASLLVAIGIAVTACGSSVDRADINTSTKFKTKDYGVKSSKRVTVAKKVKKGGGSYKVGQAYKVKGRWFYPKEEKDYDKKGMASWYGPNFHGRLTANGEIYDQYHLSAAHPTFPLPSYARVTNLKNGHSVVVRVNDRGPFEKNRIIDVSSQTADLLDMKRDGLANVRVEYVGRARMDGKDMRYLMASFERDGRRAPAPAIDDGKSNSGVMLAMNGPKRAIASVFGVGEANAVSKNAPDKPSVVALAPSGADVTVVKGGRLPVVGEITLPEFGPIPRARPSLMPAIAEGTPASSPALSSYAQMRVEQQADTPFGEILSEGNRLTGSMITASWKRRNL